MKLTKEDHDYIIRYQHACNKVSGMMHGIDSLKEKYGLDNDIYYGDCVEWFAMTNLARRMIEDIKAKEG